MAPTVDPAAVVANLGFLVRWDLPAADHDALLVVALRPTPTERHFDPELIVYWRTGENGRGHRAELTVASGMPRSHEFSWGPIEIIDRFGITNTFVSFGGTLTGERDPADAAIIAFRSSGPLLRRGGHSQRYDGLAAAVCSFFGRMLVPIDFRPGAERRLSAASPLVRYAAFLRHELPRVEIPLVREAYGADARLVVAEAERVERRDPAAWRAGGELLETLGLSPTTPIRRAAPSSATG